jgi:transcriptional regulator with XRE-family HTH domain
MAFSYDKLRGRIVEKYGSQTNFANALGVSTKTLSLKMNNRIYFTQAEIKKAADLLDISLKDIDAYFFTLNV